MPTIEADRPIVLVTAVVLLDRNDRNDRILISRRPQNKPMAGLWEFPGGKLNSGENDAACLQRELQEELGIQASIGAELYRTCHTYSTGSSVALTFFHIPAFQGQLVNHVFETLVWVKPAQLPQYDFLEGNVGFVTRLAQGHWKSLFSRQ